MDNNNRVFTLWVEGLLDEFTKLSIRSWLKLEYEVDLFMYGEPEAMDIAEFPEVNFLNAADYVLKPPLQNYAEIADYFRFNYLFCEGGTWIDSDLILLKHLPDDKIIISSEHARQCNCYSPKDRDFTANIGVLRFEVHSIILLQTIIKVNEAINRGLKTNSNRNNLMKIFQRIIHKDYRELVADPNLYCGVSWAYAKELYMEKAIINKGKYGIVQQSSSWLMENSIGIHLWRNLALTKGYYNNKVDDSFFQKLKDLIEI